MNLLQRLCLFVLIAISLCYVYFSFFNNNEKNFYDRNKEQAYNPLIDFKQQNDVQNQKNFTLKNVKIFVVDKTGNLHSLNRTCETTRENSCFEFAIKELINGPTKWEKSKGFTSEIPISTKILSIRESQNSIMIDLSHHFEAGGGAESTYTKVKQIIKTANANTNLPTYLYINGKQANVIGGEGIMIKQPLSERSFDE